jgi:hypothetical protein
VLVQEKGSNNLGELWPHSDVFKSSTLSTKGESIHHVNKGVEVEHKETSFDYQSLRYTVNKRETMRDDFKDGNLF